MAKTSWNKTLSEVLKQQTRTVTLKSEKTGNEYQTDVVPTLYVRSTGSVEKIDNKYRYSVVDTKNDFGSQLQFKNVKGGATSNGIGWYAADSVSLIQHNA